MGGRRGGECVEGVDRGAIDELALGVDVGAIQMGEVVGGRVGEPLERVFVDALAHDDVDSGSGVGAVLFGGAAADEVQQGVKCAPAVRVGDAGIVFGGGEARGLVVEGCGEGGGLEGVEEPADFGAAVGEFGDGEAGGGLLVARFGAVGVGAEQPFGEEVVEVAEVAGGAPANEESLVFAELVVDPRVVEETDLVDVRGGDLARRVGVGDDREIDQPFPDEYVVADVGGVVVGAGGDVVGGVALIVQRTDVDRVCGHDGGHAGRIEFGGEARERGDAVGALVGGERPQGSLGAGVECGLECVDVGELRHGTMISNKRSLRNKIRPEIPCGATRGVTWAHVRTILWRVRLYRGGSVFGSTVSNPDVQNEWWAVETPEGLTYTFGTNDDSLDWVPVYEPGCPGASFGFCDRAYKWNVDTVRDPFGNEMVWEYRQEKNWYAARGQYDMDYIKASHLTEIRYGANPGQGKAPNARVLFDYEWRCGSSKWFSVCPSVPGHFYDTPWDLWCGPHVTTGLYPTNCTENAPTFWTQLRWTGVLAQVADGAGGWVTTANHDPWQGMETAPNRTSPDTERTAVLFKFAERPIESANGESYNRFGFNPLHVAESDAIHANVRLLPHHDIGSEISAENLRRNQWMRFDDVWLGDSTAPATEITLRFSAYKTGSLEVRLGSTTGEVVGTFSFPLSVQRPNWQDFQTLTIPTTRPLTGVEDVYLVPKRTADNGHFMFANWFRFGRDDTAPIVELAETRFEGMAWLENRLNHPGSISAMVLPRISSYKNQMGGQTFFVYGQDFPCDANAAVPPGNWSNNHLDCFPQWDTSTGSPGWAIFNKWTVQRMTLRGGVGGGAYSPDVVTNYAYTKPGWGFSDNPDSSNDTWSDFRGYNVVRVTDADGTTEHRFFQGLHGERLSPPGTNSETVRRSNNAALTDQYWLRGRPYETRRVDGAGSGYFSREWTDYTAPTTTGLTGRTDPRFVAPSLVRSWPTVGEEHRVRYSYNGWGQPTAIRDYGRWWSGGEYTADDQTTVIRYYAANTSGAIGAWRGPFSCVTGLRAGLSTAAPGTGNSSGFLRYAQTFFDGSTTRNCNAQVTKPVPTRTETYRTNTGRVVTRAQVDARGRVNKTWDGRSKTSTVAYDNLHGQPTSTTNHLGWVSTVAYDAWRRPIRSTDVNGRQTLTDYDRYSRVTKVANPGDSLATPTVKYTYRQASRPVSVQTQTRLTGSHYSNSAVFFDGFGREVVSRTLSPRSNESWVTAASFDDMGRAFRSSVQYAVPGDNVTTFTYPNWGTVASFTETQYDTLSRPFEVYQRKGVNGTISNLFRESYRYSAFQTSYYDARRLRTDTYHEGRGRVTEVRENALGSIKTRYGYNAADDLTWVSAPDGAVTSMGYDRMGRKVWMDDPDTGQWSYTYDATSNMTRQVDPSGTDLRFTYDALGRMTHRKLADGTIRGFWRWDPVGNRGGLWYSDSRQSEGTVRRQFWYDSLGRVSVERLRVPQPGSTSLWSFDTEFSYRDDHQVASVRYPTSAGGASGAAVSVGFEWRTGLPFRLVSATEGVLVDETWWKQTGQPWYREFGSNGAQGLSVQYFDNHRLWLTQTRGGPVGAEGAWHRLQYAYDANGNVTRVRDVRNSNQRQCFAYDALDRLVRAFTDNTDACDGFTAHGVGVFNESYTYDAGGDLRSRTGVGTYTYGDGGHVHAVTATSSGDSFAYDADGKMVVRDLAGVPSQVLVWDADQRLDEVRPTGGTVTSFLYDADGRRVRRQTGATTTFYVGGAEYERTGNSGVFTHWHSLAGTTVAFTETSGNTGGVTSWLWTDHLGSSTLTRDETGVRRVQRYGPWGEVRTDGNLSTDRAFTGQIADEATGLAFYNARYYDPTVGRFISPDSIVPSPLNGQDYNRYTYVRNNPVKYTDPTGNVPGGFSCPAGVQHMACFAFHDDLHQNTNGDRMNGDSSLMHSQVSRAEGHRERCSFATCVQEVVVAGGRTLLFDERSCRGGGGSGGFDADVGCVAEAAMVFTPCKAFFKALCKQTSKVRNLFRRGGDAAPGSLRTIGSGFSASELRVAQLLADGGDTVVLREATGVGRTSDLLVNGVPYDVYTPETGNIDRIVSAVSSKGSQVQGGGVIIDLTDSPLTTAQLGDILPRVQGVTSQISDIKVVGG